MSPTDEPARPTLRVIRGDATEEEIAALLAVILARGPAPTSPARTPAPASVWNERSRALRRPVRPGPGAWRASGWSW